MKDTFLVFAIDAGSTKYGTTFASSSYDKRKYGKVFIPGWGGGCIRTERAIAK